MIAYVVVSLLHNIDLCFDDFEEVWLAESTFMPTKSLSLMSVFQGVPAGNAVILNATLHNLRKFTMIPVV